MTLISRRAPQPCGRWQAQRAPIEGDRPMKTLKLALAGVAGALALGGAAHAQDADDSGPVKLSFNVGVASDYVFRGVSQTDENPSLFGGVDATVGSIGYLGVWASNVD